jgi:glyoxylate reductase
MLLAVSRRIHADVLDNLRTHGEVRLWDSDLPPNPAEFEELLSGVDGALTLLTDRVDDALLARLPQLRAVSNLAVGYDNIDVAACTRRGVAACTTPDVLTRTTAEFTLALIFAVARQIVPAARAAREGDWTTWYPMRFLGRDLAGTTLGVVGLGRIGREVAAMSASLGLNVIYADEYAEMAEFRRVALNELLERADIVSLHVPLTPQTRGLLNASALERMRSDALLINTSRGPVVDTTALVAVLEAGGLGGVGLDVTDPEPLPADHALYSFERVTIVPHIASASIATRHRMSELAALNLIAVLTGGEPPHCLNPEVLARG